MTITQENARIGDLCRLILGTVDPQDIAETAWPQVVQLALRERLGPLLSWQLGQAGLTTWRDEHYPVLVNTMRRAATYWLVMESVRQSVEKTLADGQIPVLWLKGIALAQTVYPQASLRPMGDVDALVAPEQFRTALQLIAQATGQPVASLTDSAAMHAVMMLGPGQRIKLELHHSLLDTPISRLSADANWFMGQGQWFSTRNGGLYTLKPEIHLIYLAAHAILQHGEADFRLLRYLDLHQVITQSPDFDWQIVLDNSADLGWTYAVERALSISQALFATPLPDGLLAKLQARRRFDEDVSIAVRKQQGGNRWDVTANRFASMSWPARLQIALGLAIPPRAYMRWRYQIDAGWKVPFYYPYRWLDVAGEVLKTVGKLMGRRSGGKWDADAR